MPIHIRCRACTREVASAECDRGFRCSVCAARAAASADLAAYQRLWAKRARYGRRQVALEAIDAQLGRLAKRMAARLHERIPDGEAAAELLNGLLAEARQQADSVGGRILVPRHGQELVGGGARA